MRLFAPAHSDHMGSALALHRSLSVQQTRCTCDYLHPRSDHVLHGYGERTGFASFTFSPTDALLYALFEHAKTGPTPPPSSAARLTPACADLILSPRTHAPAPPTPPTPARPALALAAPDP